MSVVGSISMWSGMVVVGLLVGFFFCRPLVSMLHAVGVALIPV